MVQRRSEALVANQGSPPARMQRGSLVPMLTLCRSKTEHSGSQIPVDLRSFSPTLQLRK